MRRQEPGARRKEGESFWRRHKQAEWERQVVRLDNLGFPKSCPGNCLLKPHTQCQQTPSSSTEMALNTHMTSHIYMDTS